MRSTYLTALAIAATVGWALSSRAQTTNILVHDTWQDSTRTTPASPTYAENNGVIGTDADADGDLESAWFVTSSGMTVSPNHLVMTNLTGSSSAFTTYFTPGATPVTLTNVGDQIRLTWVFTPNGVNASNINQNLRFALVQTPSGSRVSADGSIPNAVYQGYAMFLNMGTKLNNANAFQLMSRSVFSGSLLGSSGNWVGLTNGAGTDLTGYIDGTQYTFIWTLKKNASGGLDITSTMSGGSLGNTGSITDSYSDATPSTNSFDTFEIRPSSGATTASQFDTALFEVDYITLPPISVLNTNDSGVGSLRQAIATATPGATIVFDPSVTNTITLSTGELVISNSLTIVGPGATNLAVSGNAASRVFTITNAVVSISGLTISNGLAAGLGGGIYNQSNLVLSACLLTGNKATGTNSTGISITGGPGSGGGVYNAGTLTLSNCIVSANAASGGTGSTSTFGGTGGGGSGGGIYNQGMLILSACALSGNNALGGTSGVSTMGSGGTGGAGLGAGIYNAGTLGLTNCTFSGNAATGGTGGAGSFGSNQSGGPGVAGSGGGIYNVGTLGLTACTLSGNSATGGTGGTGGSGGGNGGSGGNGTGGGLVQASGSVTVRNTIIAGNTSAGGAGGAGLSSGSPGTAAGPDVSGAVTTSGYDLIGKTDGSTGWGASDLTGTIAAPLNPGLGPLANNGGSTPTMALGVASPGTDKGNSFGLTTDQRGQPRPFDNPNIANASGGDGSDIGAFERQTITGSTISVLNTNDSGAGSLRQAIALVLSGDTIVFDPSVTNTITLSSGELLISQSLTIVGPGATNLAVSGNNASRVFEITNATVSISGLTISNGRAQGTNSTGPSITGGPGLGGGIYNAGTLALSNCIVSANIVTGGTGSTSSIGGNGGPGSGGGIYNQGTLILSACTFSGNNVLGGTSGVSTFGNGGTGGAGLGGGVYNASTLALTNCTFSGNSATGGSGSGGSSGGNSTGGTGGGGSGGGVYNAGTLGLTACTLGGNTATGGNGGNGGNGGGNGGSGGNGTGGGLVQASGSVTVRSTIIAGNTSAGGSGGAGGGGGSTGASGNGSAPDVSGTVTSPGYDLIGRTDGSSGWGASDLTGTIAAPLSPGLGPLANNGGPTPTMLLATGSSAIDKGNSFGIATDQRGQSRPFDNPGIPNAAGGDGSDIGAFESQNAGVSFTNTVLNTNDNGAGSLRQAIATASPYATTVIAFDPNVTGTITLNTGEMLIGKNLNIVGPGATNLTISGNNASRVFNITNATVSISGLTISNGVAVGTNATGFATGGSGIGGGIYNQSTLTLTACILSGNKATGGSGAPAGSGAGGGIYNQGTLVLVACTLSGNSVTGGTASGNMTGGGEGLGGGVYNSSGGSLTLTNCTLSGNSAAGGSASGNNFVGGAYGGGIENLGVLVLSACTLSGNSTAPGTGPAGGSGAGGGLFGETGSSVSIGNTIIAGNTATGGSPAGPDVLVVSAVSSSGYNLIGKTNDSTGWVSSDLKGSIATPLDPALGPLADNGGPTPTMALLADSIATDQGNSFGLTTDQRGQPRPFNDPNKPNALGGDGSDIGAYERQTTIGTSISVLNTNDNGAGSLRQAILTVPPSGTITFDPSVTNTITLRTGELLINKSLTIVGPGATNLAVSGNFASRAFNITNAVVSISGLTIKNGFISGPNSPAGVTGSPGLGGGIYNQSNLVLSACILSGNSARGGGGTGSGDAGGPGFGGSVYNAGALSLINCMFSGNIAQGGGGGFTFLSADFGGTGGVGSGGGIYNSSGSTLTMTNCTFSGNNLALGGGGGCSCGSGNTHPGGNGGNAFGGGVYNQATAALVNCTFNSNTATGGTGGAGSPSSPGASGNGSAGGVYNQGTLALTACTFSGNIAAGCAGGFFGGTSAGGAGGNGTGGGLVQASGSVTAHNTIIAGNNATGGAGGTGSNGGSNGANGTGTGPDVSGAVTTSGYDLIGATNASSGWVSSDLTGSTNALLNPMLGPLQDNGGPTPTMALLAGSAAIDNGKSFGLTTDQRGQPRPFDNPNIANAAGGDGSDIGAYEAQPCSSSVDIWISSTSGKWETAGNWSPCGVAPSIANSADLITNANTKTVTIDATTTNTPSTLTISNLTVSGVGGGINTLQLTNTGTATPLHVFNTMTISSGGMLVVSNSVAVVDNVSGNGTLGFYNGTGLYVGNSGLGTLTVNGGTVTIFGTTTLGLNSGSTGTVWLTGGQFSGGVTIGQNGVGRMTVSNGTLLAGVTVGAFHDGTLTVAGGTNTMTSGLTIGFFGNGTVWMTGGLLTVTNASTFIGYNGIGQMIVSNGTWLARDVALGESNAGGTLTVAGGTNTLSSILDIGASVAGAVWVSGGQLTVTNAAIYVGDGDVGQMTVSNGTIAGRDVYVGFGAPGSLTMPGGTMSALSNLVVGDCGVGITGTVTLNGGSLFVTNAAGTAVLDVRDGTVTLSSGLLKVDKIVMTNSCGHLVHTGGTLLYNQLNLDPNLSAVGDGIPNGWKQQHNLDPFDPNLANEDPDGDGFSNLQEYLAGTDPTDPNSKPLRITAVARQGGDFKITWLTLGGTTNTVQATSGTVNGSYSTNNFVDIVGSQTIIPGIGPVTTNYTESGGATNVPARYYRIRLVP
jgi:hypothetical protein